MYKIRDNNVKNVFDAPWHGKGNDGVSEHQVNVLVTRIWYPKFCFGGSNTAFAVTSVHTCTTGRKIWGLDVTVILSSMVTTPDYDSFRMPPFWRVMFVSSKFQLLI